MSPPPQHGDGGGDGGSDRDAGWRPGRPLPPTGAGVDLSGLNEPQRTAVTAPPGFHLVVAGAGTGKTRTLVHRVAWLVSQGADPSTIVLLTFTRRAAREMLDRASRMVGPAAHRVQGGTFHAFASRTLRRLSRDGRQALVGRSPDFTVMDRRDAEDLVGLVRGELGLGGRGRRFPTKGTLLKIISRAANAGEDLLAATLSVAPRYEEDVADIQAVADAYAARKRQGDLVDYDDLLVIFRDVLKTDAAARRHVASRCHHVLVDEFQDTNKVQGHIAALLATVHGDLMVVGDEAQSIYGFRGARVENILEFPQRFKGARITTLEDNYRSVQPVLDLANGVLESFATGFDKRLRSSLSSPDRPLLVECRDPTEEAEAVVAQVLAMREAGVGLDDQAVLFRSARHSAVLEGLLPQAGIPFKKYGGLRFVDLAHVKDVLAVLRLVLNPRDEVAWLRVLTWLPGVGDKTAARIIAALLLAQEEGRAPDLSAWEGRKYAEELTRLLDLVAAQRDLPLHRQVAAAVEYVRSGLDERYDDSPRRDRDLEAVPLLADRHDSLEVFLAEAALDPPEGAEVDQDEEEEFLTLSTIHSAKGLEWTGVQVLRLADGHFPSGYSLDDPDAVEEERRLLYVAVTRAKRHLLLYQPAFIPSRSAWAFGPGCTLLDDVPELSARVTRAAPRPDLAATATSDGGDLPEDDERLAEVLAWIDD